MGKIKRVSSLRLPLELIILIIKYAADENPWQLPSLSLIIRQIRKDLCAKLFESVHLRSPAHLDERIVAGWNKITKGNSYGDCSISIKNVYLRYLYRMDSEEDQYEDLLDAIEDIPRESRKEVETLAIRVLPTSRSHLALGLWTCNVLNNLKHLSVDTSMIPPHHKGMKLHENIAPYTNPDFPFMLCSSETKLESYAYASAGLHMALDLPRHPQERKKFIKDVFPRIKRLYIFTCILGKETTTHGDFADLANDFDSLTNIELIAHIVIQGVEPADWCAPECNIYGYPNGSMVMQDVVIDQSSSLE